MHTSLSHPPFVRRARSAAVLLASTLALGACDSRSESRGLASKTQPPATDRAASTDPTAKLLGSTPGLPSPLVKVALGMSLEEAKAAAPDVFADEGGYPVPGLDGVWLYAQTRAHESGSVVHAIHLSIPQSIHTAKGWLTGVWGTPRSGTTSDDEPAYYFDRADVGLRVTLRAENTGSHVSYFRVMSLEQLLGTAPGRFGFETLPLLGASVAEVTKSYAATAPRWSETGDNVLTLSLPALTNSNASDCRLFLRIVDDNVSGYRLTFATGGDATADAAVVARLEQLFGKGIPGHNAGEIKFAGPPRAVAHRGAPALEYKVVVGDYNSY